MRFCLAACCLGTGCECGEPPCFEGSDTAFGQIQTQIFDQSCISFTGCHNGDAGENEGNLDLCGPDTSSRHCRSSARRSYEQLVGVPAECGHKSDDCPDPECVPDDADRPIRVVPGEPSASYLYRRVSGEGLTECVRRMPWSGKLCDASVDAIRTWIENGAEP